MRSMDFSLARKLISSNFHLPADGDPGDTRYTLWIHGDFFNEFQKQADSNEGLYEINEMQRNADGSIRIPGSSIKGAIRTAIISERLKKMPSPLRYRGLELNLQKRSAPRALEGFALDSLRVIRDTDLDMDINQDPFRVLHIHDAFANANAGRLVQARNRSLGRQDRSDSGIPMQLEVISGCAFSTEKSRQTWSFKVDITFDNWPNAQKQFGAPLSIEEIQRACTDFFSARFCEEVERFYKPWGVAPKCLSA